jgi:hypothetical protein
MSETSLPQEIPLLPEAVITNPLAQARYQPHLREAATITLHAIEQEEIYGSIPIVQKTYQEAADKFIEAANRGKDIDFDPVTLAANWAVIGSMLEAGPVEEYPSESPIDGDRIATSDIPEDRREHLANITRDYLSDSSITLADQFFEGEARVANVVEAGIMAAQHIESLGREGLLKQLDPTKKRSDSNTSYAALKRAGAILDEVLEEHPTEEAEGLDRVIDIYKNHPEQHRRLSRFALKAMIEADPSVLIEAAQQIEEQSTPYTFAQAA